MAINEDFGFLSRELPWLAERLPTACEMLEWGSGETAAYFGQQVKRLRADRQGGRPALQNPQREHPGDGPDLPGTLRPARPATAGHAHMNNYRLTQFCGPSHSYCGHEGPWLERAFHAEAVRRKCRFARPYLVGYWTDYMANKPHPGQLGRYMRRVACQGLLFTVVQHCRGFDAKWPKNLLVFGAGGTGDVPLPLLIPNLEPDFELRQRRYFVSFIGRTTGHNDKRGMRQKMLEVFADSPEFAHLPLCDFTEYCATLRGSEFVLCPCGYGPTSYRLYETLVMGSIPVYIHDGQPWLPYEDRFDWEETPVLCSPTQFAELPERLAAIDEAQRRRMRERARELYEDHFTISGVVSAVQERVKERTP